MMWLMDLVLIFYAEGFYFYAVHFHVSINCHVSIPSSTGFFLMRMESPLMLEFSPVYAAGFFFRQSDLF